MSEPAQGGSCRVCRGPVSLALRAREMQHGSREPFDYLVCHACGCLQIDRIPVDLERLYPEDYYTEQRNLESRRAARASRRIRRAWTACRLRAGVWLRPFAGARYGRFDWFTRTAAGIDTAILDVGCGSGRLLRRLHREGFRNLTGIDPRLSDDAGRTIDGDGPRLLRETLEEHEGRYHLVMSHHSFEHCDDPRQAFGAFARLVEEKGWLLLRVPLADSWAFRHYGRDWVQLDAPRHRHLHTRKSIGHLAREFGFRIDRVVDDSGPFQVWGSELYRRDISLVEARQNPGLHLGRGGRLVARIRSWIPRIAEQGDQACFYLERCSLERGPLESSAGERLT